MTVITLKTCSQETNEWYIDSCAMTYTIIKTGSDKGQGQINLNDEQKQVYTATEESVKSVGKG